MASLQARKQRRRIVQLLVLGPMASLLVGFLLTSANLISRPVPAFAQTPIPAGAEIHLIADHKFLSVFENEKFQDSIFNNADCQWATDAEAGALIGGGLVRWGDGISVCGFYAPRGEFVVYVYPTWETKHDVECRFGLLLASGEGGCLDVNRWRNASVTILVDGHFVYVGARTTVDRHKLLGFANMVSARMKDKLGSIDLLFT